MEIEEIKEIVEKNNKLGFKTCFNCRYKLIKPNNSYLSTGWYYGKENVESLNFRCKYLGKKVSETTSVYQDTKCICWKPEEQGGN